MATTRKRSQRERAAEAYRKRVLRLEKAELARLSARYERSLRNMQRELDALMNRWEAAKLSGQAISDDVLLRQVRIRLLADRIHSEVAAFAKQAPEAFEATMTLSARLGSEAASELINASGVFSTSPTVSAGAIREIAASLSNGSPLDALLKDVAGEAADRASSILTDGVLRGRNPRVVARELDQVLRAPYYRAERIARTEMLRAYREANRQTYVESPVVTGWRWHAEPDACGGCLAMHGELFDVEDELDGHPNCRCAMIPETVPWESLGVEGLDEVGFDESARDSIMRDKSEDDLVRQFGRQKGEALHAGELRIEDLVTRTRSDEWGTMRREATFKEALKNAQRRKRGQ